MYRMRRSFGPGAGGSMGGGGGGMMQTMHRVVRAGTGGRTPAQEPFPNSDTNHNRSNNSRTSRRTHKSSSSDNNSNTLSFSSNNHPSPFSSVNHPTVVAAAAPNCANPTSPTSSEEYDWECVGVNGFYDGNGFDFSAVPSIDEVHHAVSSLQQVLDPPNSSHKSSWEFDWIEPSGNALQSPGTNRVYDAFHLLQTEPSVKRMVVSLSSDRAVWDAVMNNEVVRELRDSVNEASKIITGSSNKVESFDGSIPVSDVLLWIFTNTKAKVVEIVEKIIEMVKGLFQSLGNEKAAKGEGAASEPFEKKLRSSFLLTVMVLLIVVVSRVSRS